MTFSFTIRRKMTLMFLAFAFVVISGMSGINTAFAQTFSDVDANNPNYEAIEFVKYAGFVKGYDDGTYRPDQKINRAEFTKIVLLAKYYGDIEEFKDGDNHTGGFLDVPAGSWFNGYVYFAKNNKILKGYDNGTFGPTNDINFGEASKIIVNTLISKTDAGSTGNWWDEFAKRLENIGVKTYEGTHFITRGEMADMIWKTKGQYTFNHPDEHFPTFDFPAPFGVYPNRDEVSDVITIFFTIDSESGLKMTNEGEPLSDIIFMSFNEESLSLDSFIKKVIDTELMKKDCEKNDLCSRYELYTYNTIEDDPTVAPRIETPIDIDGVKGKMIMRTMYTGKTMKNGQEENFTEKLYVWKKNGRINVLAEGSQDQNSRYFINQGFGIIANSLRTPESVLSVTPQETAQCLQDKNAIFYGADWCPHCKAQKKLFGESLAQVNYIDCAAAENVQTCADAGIKSYPTWVFADGTQTTGEKSLSQLFQLAGCDQ